MNEIIICVAPCPGDNQTEPGPGPVDTVAEVAAAFQVGASVAHLHVRDAQGRQSADPRLFQEQVRAIKETCPVIIEGSTGGTPDHSLEERSAVLTAEGLELGSLNMGSINLGGGVYCNPWSEIIFYAQRMKALKVRPMPVIFDLSMFFNARLLADQGLIPTACGHNFVLDAPQAMPYSDQVLRTFLEYLPPGSPWFLTRHHSPGAEGLRAALELGGHVRVGFEDGPFLSSGKRAGSNAELVEEAAALAREVGREAAGPKRAREILGLVSTGSDSS